MRVRDDVPLFGFIGRLDHQKGVDLITECQHWLLGRDAQPRPSDWPRQRVNHTTLVYQYRVCYITQGRCIVPAHYHIQ